jgi:hypothetical protein
MKTRVKNYPSSYCFGRVQLLFITYYYYFSLLVNFVTALLLLVIDYLQIKNSFLKIGPHWTTIGYLVFYLPRYPSFYLLIAATWLP